MNPITYNNDLEPSDDFYFGGKRQGGAQWMPQQVMESPIFVWDQIDDKKVEKSIPDVAERLELEPDLLPFRQMRLHINPSESSKLEGGGPVKLWLSHEDGVLNFLYVVAEKDSSPLLGQGRTTPAWTGSLQLRVKFKGVWNTNLNTPDDATGLMTDVSLWVFAQICWFVREYNSSSNSVFSVKPDKPGKSVEWTKSRMHYVLINRNHPANSPDVKSGEEVKVDSKAMKRMAHSRRAYKRILGHPRYGKNIGREIHVRACWVGPIEFKAFGSIYKKWEQPGGGKTKPNQN